MLPFDPTVAIVFGTMLVALILTLVYAAWYQSIKHRSGRKKGADPDKSVGVAELEEMMRRTVAEALAPLEDRFDGLEERVRTIQRALPPRIESADRVLPAPKEEESPTPLPTARKQR
jgi:hypothetical protein